MTSTNIAQLIDTSFLPAAQKKELHAHLAEHGDDAQFYTLFNERLIAEIQRRKTKYLDVMRVFDTEVGETQRAFADQRAALEQELEKQLADIPAADVAKRAPIWDAYYKKLDALQKEFEKNLQAVLVPLMSAAVK